MRLSRYLCQTEKAGATHFIVRLETCWVSKIGTRRPSDKARISASFSDSIMRRRGGLRCWMLSRSLEPLADRGLLGCLRFLGGSCPRPLRMFMQSDS